MAKTNPPPNLACKCFTHFTETILWVQKADKKARKHPTQKPEYLLEIIIQAST